LTRVSARDGQLEEARVSYRLEAEAREQQIEQMKKQLEETEALLKASQDAVHQDQDNNDKQNAATAELRAELDKVKLVAKEEEEKRVKAISLLKTVRQKLVKAEKEKEDALREVSEWKGKDRQDREQIMAEISRLQSDLDAANTEKERSVQSLRLQFDKELAGWKDQHQTELSAMQGQFELEAMSAKASCDAVSHLTASRLTGFSGDQIEGAHHAKKQDRRFGTIS
jgi:chromosome segregation ATPase